MSNTLRIKRTVTTNRPASLANAEIAFIEGSQTLVYGLGAQGEGGSATTIIDIGGAGAFLGLSAVSVQEAAGDYTFSGDITITGSADIGAATASQPLANDDSARVATTAWVNDRIENGTGGGTTTSVGLSMPDLFVVAGSPVTSSGTLAVTLKSQQPNTFLSGPTTGSSSSPTFRSIALADLPDVSATYLRVDTASATFLSKNSASTTYAPLLSPNFSGSPTAPTPQSGANNTLIATTQYVDSAVSDLVGSSPELLNTLEELSAAIGNDANFATSITTSIGQRLARSNNLNDVENVVTARSNLGLGSMALQSKDAVDITGGSISGITLDGGQF